MVVAVPDNKQEVDYNKEPAMKAVVQFLDRDNRPGYMENKPGYMENRPEADMDCKQEGKVLVKGRRFLLQDRTVSSTADSRGRYSTPTLDSLFQPQGFLASKEVIASAHFLNRTLCC